MIAIPDDIAATAEALVDELHANPDVTFAGILAGPTFERRITETLAAERERSIGAIDTLRESLMEGLMTDAGLTEADRVAMNHQLAALELAAEAIRNPTGA